MPGRGSKIKKKKARLKRERDVNNLMSQVKVIEVSDESRKRKISQKMRSKIKWREVNNLVIKNEGKEQNRESKKVRQIKTSKLYRQVN